MLSLRKAAYMQQQGGQIFGLPTANDHRLQDMRFPYIRRGPNGKGDDIPLDTLPVSHLEMR